jgi:phosphoenolpyruvate synthase/pyruvate phosphate dikinase
MIELPRSSRRARGPAIAEFFSFLTNDLIQSTFRISQHRSGWWQ